MEVVLTSERAVVLGRRRRPVAQIAVEEFLPGGRVHSGGVGDDAVEVEQDRIVVAGVDRDS